MDSLPEFDVVPRRDKSGVFIGGYLWEVYDAASQGPIDGGFAQSKKHAHIQGCIMRDHYARVLYGQPCITVIPEQS